MSGAPGQERSALRAPDARVSDGAAGRAVPSGSAVKLPVAWPEAAVEPARPHGLGTQLPHALEEQAVGADHDDAAGGRRGLGNESVIAIVDGVYNAHAVDIFLRGAGSGDAFEDDHSRQWEPPEPRGIAELLDELARRTRPVPPPPGGPGPNDIGAVNHEHAPKVRASRQWRR